MQFNEREKHGLSNGELIGACYKWPTADNSKFIEPEHKQTNKQTIKRCIWKLTINSNFNILPLIIYFTVVLLIILQAHFCGCSLFLPPLMLCSLKASHRPTFTSKTLTVSASFACIRTLYEHADNKTAASAILNKRAQLNFDFFSGSAISRRYLDAMVVFQLRSEVTSLMGLG